MNNKKFIIFLVNFAIPLGGMSSDIYLPSLPAMSHYFQSPNSYIQLTITLFTLGLGIGQLLTGPISDALGRKKLFITGMILQLAMLLIIININSIHIFILVRLFQGLGAAFMMVTSRAMLNDTFHGDDLKKQYTYMTASFALGPIVAPFIGGYLQHYLGWRSNFYFITIYDCIALALSILFLKETLLHKKSFSVEHAYHSYTTVLKNKFFIASGLLVGLFMSYMATFNVLGPFLIQNLFGKSAVYYGYIALFMGVAWFSGNIANRVLVMMPIEKKSKIAFCIMLINALAMFLLSLLGLDIYFLIIPVFIMLFLGGFLFSTYVSECLSLFKAQAASANGLLFALIWLIFSLFTFIGTLMKTQSLLPISNCFLGIAFIITIWYVLVVKKSSSKHIK